MSKTTAKLLLGLLALVGICTVLSTRGGFSTVSEQATVPVPGSKSFDSIKLSSAFVVMYQPSDGREASKESLTSMKKLNARLILTIEKGLGGKILTTYDSVFVGLSCELDYTDKVLKALGSEEIPSDVEKETLRRFHEFLCDSAEDLLKDHKLDIIVERDGTFKTQKVDQPSSEEAENGDGQRAQKEEVKEGVPVDQKGSE